MKTEKFERAIEIQKEFGYLNDMENNVKKYGVDIKMTYFDNWKHVKVAFDRKTWQDNLKELIMCGIDKRKKELEKEFEEL